MTEMISVGGFKGRPVNYKLKGIPDVALKS